MNGSLSSPEAVIMLPFAILIDLIGIVLVCFVLDDFWITDIIAISFIGTWIFIRSKGVKVTKKVEAKVGKVAKKMKKLRWLRPICIIAEFIPYVGAFPCWTILVYFELKS